MKFDIDGFKNELKILQLLSVLWKMPLNLILRICFLFTREINSTKKIAFEDVVVMPTRNLFCRPTLLTPFFLFFGGPIWPKKHPIWVRTCIFPIPLIADRASPFNGIPENIIDCGIWCGPVVGHFGHAVADFGMRIATSAHKNPDKMLLFTIPLHANVDKYVPDFFWDMIKLLGAKKENIYFINIPTKVKKLIVYPQAERYFGGSPSLAYLNLLSSLTPVEEKIYPVVYLSRGNYYKGGVAGERYLEIKMAESGVLVVRPEEYSLEEQVRFCKQAKTLIITEGSAVHLLQLIGGNVGDVIIICRRSGLLEMNGNKLGKDFLLPRARSIRYLDAVETLIHKQNFLNEYKGITVLNINKFILDLSELGFDLRSVWNNYEYEKSRDIDVLWWVKYVLCVNFDNNHTIKVTAKWKSVRHLKNKVMDLIKIAQNKLVMCKKLRDLGIIDLNYYVRSNPDVRTAGVDPYSHFLAFGINELRSPSVYFDLKYYVENNQEIKHLSGLDLFLHYFTIGWQEGRNPSSYFDTKFYLSQNHDSIDVDPLSHYLKIGWRKNWNPNSYFDIKFYLVQHPEIVAAGLEPLKHAIENGHIFSNGS